MTHLNAWCGRVEGAWWRWSDRMLLTLMLGVVGLRVLGGGGRAGGDSP